MIDKFVPDLAAAMADIPDGATVMAAGFGPGTPTVLMQGLAEQGACELTLVVNAGGRDDGPIADLLKTGHIRKLICSSCVPTASPAGFTPTANWRWRSFAGHAGRTDPRRRRRRAGVLHTDRRRHGAGRGPRNTPHQRRLCLLEYPIFADVALVDAWQADRFGNLTHRDSARNFNPIMAMAAKLTIAQTAHVVDLGDIRPEHVHTAGVFVQRVLHVPV